ncbi:MAG: [LysW]-lysine hydrolase [Halodesulfurarchaeum sp.]
MSDASSEPAESAVSSDVAQDLLLDLVDTPSVSGNESACADRLQEFFRAHGRESFLDDVGNVRAPGDESVLLTSHLDTVPGDIPVRIEDGTLWGRGSVDAKGSLAAMAAAAVRTGVSFAGVVSEETTSAGAKHLVASREPPEALINGEPSGWDALTLGYRGLLSGTYRCETPAGHSSRPEPNAIQKGMAWWNRVREAVVSDDGSPIFDSVTAKPVSIHGGTAADGLAVDLELEVEFRLPPGTTGRTIKDAAESALDDGGVTWTETMEGVQKSPRQPVARALRSAIREGGGEPRHLRKSGTSDMNTYGWAWDIPMATYGPGDSSLDHTPDERLSLDEFDRALAVLTDAATRLSQ